MLSEMDRRREFDRVPFGTDILITHGPPKGILDGDPGIGDPPTLAAEISRLGLKHEQGWALRLRRDGDPHSKRSVGDDGGRRRFGEWPPGRLGRGGRELVTAYQRSPAEGCLFVPGSSREVSQRRSHLLPHDQT
jgi:hypothetical protein